jgi:N,N'-diacetyllegionaminate synthase
MQITTSFKAIGTSDPVFIIAEAGVNHNGDIKLAHKLIDAAAAAGADAVKFQTFLTDELVSNGAPLAGHHIANVKDATSHYDILKRLELSFSSFQHLKTHCKEKNILFLSTPYDIPSAELLINMQTELIKIASSEMMNYPLLDVIGRSKIPIILSTGMNSWEEIEDSVNFLKTYNTQLCILKCTSNYPALPESINLRGIERLKESFSDCLIGFSDHTEGNEISLAALGLGACILEKHFTLDKKQWGPDHSASMVPDEFGAFVKSVRKVEEALGKKNWEIQNKEKAQRETMQKGVYARCNIEKGERLDISKVKFLRPKGKSSPKDFWEHFQNKPVENKIYPGEEIHIGKMVPTKGGIDL